MDIANVNWFAVVIAAVSAFLVGGIWYGPVFGKAWMTEFGFKEEDLKKRNPGKIFGISLLLSFIVAFNLEMFLGPDADIAFGTMAGFLAGFGWVAAMLGIIYLFEMRSMKAFIINGGYCILALTLMGLILGTM